jgi:hypothetical protein
VTDSAGAALATTSPSGYGPADLRGAYSLDLLSSSQGSGHTVAVVAAHDNPTAESDLAVYRAQYGLPPCTTANGCFSKRDQAGGVSYPLPDAGWGGEIALDLDMASAVCPKCRIMLVEASSDSVSDLGAAVNTAVSLGASEISNSYGSSEYLGESRDQAYYDHPGIAITAASGDSGYGVQFPAASGSVTAVGGTSLVRAAGARGWTESAWASSGSGCSVYIAKPAWQTDAGCGNRTVGDVSAVADPATGVAVFHTDGSNPAASGWMVFGGTSVSAPIVAGVYALKGHTGGANPFGQLAPFFDVSSGANGSCGTYLCQSGPGFDGPTGIGSPDGGAQTTAAPPGGSSAQPPTRSQPPVSSASAPPTLTLRQAARDARKALASIFGRSFKHRRGLRLSCRRKSRVAAVCAVSWRSGSSSYSGSLTITSAVGAGGRMVRRVTYTITRRTGRRKATLRGRTTLS